MLYSSPSHSPFPVLSSLSSLFFQINVPKMYTRTLKKKNLEAFRVQKILSPQYYPLDKHWLKIRWRERRIKMIDPCSWVASSKMWSTGFIQIQLRSRAHEAQWTQLKFRNKQKMKKWAHIKDRIIFESSFVPLINILLSNYSSCYFTSTHKVPPKLPSAGGIMYLHTKKGEKRFGFTANNEAVKSLKLAARDTRAPGPPSRKRKKMSDILDEATQACPNSPTEVMTKQLWLRKKESAAVAVNNDLQLPHLDQHLILVKIYHCLKMLQKQQVAAKCVLVSCVARIRIKCVARIGIHLTISVWTSSLFRALSPIKTARNPQAVSSLVKEGRTRLFSSKRRWSRLILQRDVAHRLITESSEGCYQATSQHLRWYNNIYFSFPNKYYPLNGTNYLFFNSTLMMYLVYCSNHARLKIIQSLDSSWFVKKKKKNGQNGVSNMNKSTIIIFKKIALLRILIFFTCISMVFKMVDF
ncbi:hypothetical protein VP01_780g2 [Puccinia sorghi]|uniref:Uncharacterized protein n=1 Tax=Puccinia sorghi TaxID=27349 RepID=A0A0L6UB75_9BASI|nr:hypothetical protein VP01_780g2 [Puccinia sorghi]